MLPHEHFAHPTDRGMRRSVERARGTFLARSRVRARRTETARPRPSRRRPHRPARDAQRFAGTAWRRASAQSRTGRAVERPAGRGCRRRGTRSADRRARSRSCPESRRPVAPTVSRVPPATRDSARLAPNGSSKSHSLPPTQSARRRRAKRARAHSRFCAVVRPSGHKCSAGSRAVAMRTARRPRNKSVELWTCGHPLSRRLR